MEGLLRLHRLSVAGQEDSEAADAVREIMCEPWEGLTNAEKERFTGLSKDLYTISDGFHQPTEPMNPQAQSKLNEAYEARERGDFDKALELLRRWDKYVARELASYLRGTIWRAAGEPSVAAVFFKHASDLAPENDNFHAVLLHTLKTADFATAKARAEEVLRESESRSPATVLYAADIMYEAITKLPDPDALPAYKQLIPILERTLIRMHGHEDVGKVAVAGMAFSLLATCYKDLGDTQKASAYYSRAIQLDPTNYALLIARGILLYGADPNASDDFLQAIQLGSPVVWPYFYLAHHYLANNRFEDCRTMCERALTKPINSRIESQLYEFLAISLASLGQSEQSVRRAFEQAIRVDPSNERARRNMEKFEEALANRTSQGAWERITESSMRSFGKKETRFDPTLLERRKLESN
jgi:tetratricopeptide (TPR) repeat protein